MQKKAKKAALKRILERPQSRAGFLAEDRASFGFLYPHRPCPPIGPMLLLISSRTPPAATSHGSCWSGTQALLISPYRTWKQPVLKPQPQNKITDGAR
jgi:hypothetical protein